MTTQDSSARPRVTVPEPHGGPGAGPAGSAGEGLGTPAGDGPDVLTGAGVSAPPCDGAGGPAGAGRASVPAGAVPGVLCGDGPGNGPRGRPGGGPAAGLDGGSVDGGEGVPGGGVRGVSGEGVPGVPGVPSVSGEGVPGVPGVPSVSGEGVPGVPGLPGEGVGAGRTPVVAGERTAVSAGRRGAGRGAAGPAVALARNRLLERLDRGDFGPGGQLPGERRLAKETGVSRSSLRHALALLRAEGRLDSSAQRGWYVRTGEVNEPAGVLPSFTGVARARGLAATSAVLGQRVRGADFDEAAKLRIPPASDVVHLVRLRALDGLPVCVEESVLPAARFPGLAWTDLTDRSLFAVLAELAGARVSRSHYAARACAADADQARLLGIEDGTPVLVCEEITVDQDNTPVLLGTSAHRGDAYRFEAVLYRSTP